MDFCLKTDPNRTASTPIYKSYNQFIIPIFHFSTSFTLLLKRGKESNRKREMAESSSSTATAPKPKSDTEIEEMLDRMLTRLALCDDSKLEPLLSKLLPLTISSLSSSSTAVRNKVLRRRISISLLLHHRKLLITQLLSYKLVSISHFMLKLLN
jgi:hypothetical protein